MADVHEVLVEIGKIIATGEGLFSSEFIPDKLDRTPFVLVTPEEGIFDNDFGGDDRYTVLLTVLCDGGTFREKSSRLYATIDQLKALFASFETLNSKVSWAHLMSFRNFGDYEYNGRHYLGLELLLDVQD